MIADWGENGFVLKEIFESRLKICKSCDSLNKKTFLCKECHCYMDSKTLLEYAKCPLYKW